jgi:replicative superfamily II helicase
MAYVLGVYDLASFGAPPDLVEVWRRDVVDLTDIQERAVQAGVLDGKTNLVVVAPTSSGKTFVGEMAAAVSAYTRRQRAIFIVPFKALADEHYDHFHRRYADLLSVVISTADWTEFDADIRAGSFNLAVMTYEKLMGFLAYQPELAAQCTTIVVDEVQTLSEGDRGARLEVLLTQLITAEDPPQIVALSASVDDVNHLDTWLQARLVSSDQRPVPLTQRVCDPSGSAVVLAPAGPPVYSERLISDHADRETLITGLVRHFLADGKQVIIFRSTVSKVVGTARNLRGELPATGASASVNEQLSALDDSEAINDLRLCLASGVGFHNADLTRAERAVVEGAFRAGEAKVLVATTTLSMGVNLPSDVVIIADTTRPVLGRRDTWSNNPITVSEYRNAAGRAGRLGQRLEGSSILIAENFVDQRQLVNFYLLGQIDPIKSQIPSRPLADVVFSIICSELAHDEDGIVEFIAATYAYLTYYENSGGLGEVRRVVSQAVSACLDSKLVALDESRIYPTGSAQIFGAAGFSLATAVNLSLVLEQALRTPLLAEDLIFEVASCSEIGNRPWPQRVHGRTVRPGPQHVPVRPPGMPGSRLATVLQRQVLSTDEASALVRSRCLLEWMKGTGLREVSESFRRMGAAGARVRELGKNAAWLLDALAEAAKLRGASEASRTQLRQLALEARYGLPSGLAPLARLRVPGITRDDLLRLYQGGQDRELYDPEAVLDAPDSAFIGILTPVQVARLRQAIRAETVDSMRRQHAGQATRAEQANLSRKIIDDLYTRRAGGLEQAVADAFNCAGLVATRIFRQPQGEEDIRVVHTTGTVVISVTASQDDARPIRWNKAKEILGAGTGLNPVNYVCIGRPGFESLAERSAGNIARETGQRSILLIPMAVFAESIVRVAQGTMNSNDLSDILANRRGILDIESFPSKESPAP